jgi:3-methyladenine DNA glycosylase Tag
MPPSCWQLPEAEEKTETKEGPAGKQIQKETETDLKKKEIKSIAICVFFSFLQVTGILTAGRERKRRRS